MLSTTWKEIIHEVEGIRTRWLESILPPYLRTMPVLVISGARQTGKSTFAQTAPLLADRSYLTFDRVEVQGQARRAPDELLRTLPATFDEVQREPSFLLAVKRRVDEGRVREPKRMPGSIVLTGSANFALLEKVNESLTGRAAYLHLPPFCPGEWIGRRDVVAALDALFADSFDPDAWPSGVADWTGWAERGGYPDVLKLGDSEARGVWFDAYVETYLERDLRQLANVENLPDFRRLMQLAAHRCGRLVNQSEFGRDAQLPTTTTHRYLNLLEAGYQIARLPNFRRNVGRSLAKARKLMWTDAGLAAWLANVSAEELAARPDRGFWLEQVIYQSLQSWVTLGPRRSVSFWREDPYEVDFVLEQAGRLVAIEVKSTTAVSPDDLSGLRAFQAAFSRKDQAPPRGVVLHGGERPFSFGSDLHALSLHPFAPPL